jgi:hypothetical protein
MEKLSTGCGMRSKSTVISYMKLLSTARKMCGGVTVEMIIKNPTDHIAQIESCSSEARLSAHSVASYMTSILAAIKHVISCESKARLKKEIAAWQDAHRRWHLRGEQPYLQNKCTAKQQSGWVPYEVLCSVRDAQIPGSKGRLLLALYTYIPPCRADLGACRILRRDPTSKELGLLWNYMVLQPPESKNLSYLHLQHFKTSRCYPQGIKTALLATLCYEIEASLRYQPRQFLFTQEHSGRPYTRKSFSTMASRLLQNCTGNTDINIQLLRHIYVTVALQRYDSTKLPAGDLAGRALFEKRLADIAHAMGHSKQQQERYRFALTGSGQPQLLSNKVVPHRTGKAEPLVIELLQ